MDTIIKENVGTGRGVWDGQSAGAFAEEWNQYSTTELPNLETKLKTPAEKLKAAIFKMHNLDQ